MSPQEGRGFNCWFPIAVRVRSALEIENQGKETRFFYFYVDWEEHRTIDPDLGRFHAWWNRVPQRPEQRRSTATGAPTTATPTRARPALASRWRALEAAEPHRRAQLRDPRRAGRRAHVGCNLNVDVFERQRNDWYGEGDDMIFVDDEPWPLPARHRYGGLLQHRLLPKGGVQRAVPRLDGVRRDRGVAVREELDVPLPRHPIRFTRSIRVTIETGYDNALANDYSSTAYWYQRGVNEALPPLPAVEARIPR